MVVTSRREKRLWRAAGICLVLIYSSLYVARPIVESLRERNLLRATVGLVFLLVAVLVIGMVQRWHPGWRVYLGLTLAASLYFPVFFLLHLPEERLHYFEYGLFCGLVYAALLERRQNKPVADELGAAKRAFSSPWFLALILTLAAGWIDEAIQDILPNRYYDLRDVAFNFSAGALVLVAWAIVDGSREWQARVVGDTVDH